MAFERTRKFFGKARKQAKAVLGLRLGTGLPISVQLAANKAGLGKEMRGVLREIMNKPALQPAPKRERTAAAKMAVEFLKHAQNLPEEKPPSDPIRRHNWISKKDFIIRETKKLVVLNQHLTSAQSTAVMRQWVDLLGDHPAIRVSVFKSWRFPDGVTKEGPVFHFSTPSQEIGLARIEHIPLRSRPPYLLIKMVQGIKGVEHRPAKAELGMAWEEAVMHRLLSSSRHLLEKGFIVGLSPPFGGHPVYDRLRNRFFERKETVDQVESSMGGYYEVKYHELNFEKKHVQKIFGKKQ